MEALKYQQCDLFFRISRYYNLTYSASHLFFVESVESVMAYGYNHDCDTVSQVHIHNAIEKALKDQEISDCKFVKSQRWEEKLRAVNFVKAERNRLTKTLNAVRIACHGYKSERKTKKSEQTTKINPTNKTKRPRMSNVPENKSKSRKCPVKMNLNQFHNSLLQQHNFHKSKVSTEMSQNEDNSYINFPAINHHGVKSFENKISKHADVEFLSKDVKHKTHSNISVTKNCIILPSIPAQTKRTQPRPQRTFDEFHPISPAYRKGLLKSHSGTSGPNSFKDSHHHMNVTKTNKSAPCTSFQRFRKPTSVEKSLLVHLPISKTCSYPKSPIKVFSKTLFMR